MSKNNFFKFKRNIEQQVSGTAIGTKFGTSYIYGKSSNIIFTIQRASNGYMGWKVLENFLPISLLSRAKFHSSLKFIYQPSEEKITF